MIMACPKCIFLWLNDLQFAESYKKRLKSDQFENSVIYIRANRTPAVVAAGGSLAGPPSVSNGFGFALAQAGTL